MFARLQQGWGLFLDLGPHSWGRIIEGVWRRRIGMRFMYTLLKVDPCTYTVRLPLPIAHLPFRQIEHLLIPRTQTHRDTFLRVLLDALATPSPRITFEPALAALIFAVDGCRTPLLRGVPAALPPSAQAQAPEYALTRAEFVQAREGVVRGAFALSFRPCAL